MKNLVTLAPVLGTISRSEWVNEIRVKGHIIMNLNAKEWEVGKGSSLLCSPLLCTPLLKMS